MILFKLISRYELCTKTSHSYFSIALLVCKYLLTVQESLSHIKPVFFTLIGTKTSKHDNILM